MKCVYFKDQNGAIKFLYIRDLGENSQLMKLKTTEFISVFSDPEINEYINSQFVKVELNEVMGVADIIPLGSLNYNFQNDQINVNEYYLIGYKDFKTGLDLCTSQSALAVNKKYGKVFSSYELISIQRMGRALGLSVYKIVIN